MAWATASGTQTLDQRHKAANLPRAHAPSNTSVRRQEPAPGIADYRYDLLDPWRLQPPKPLPHSCIPWLPPGCDPCEALVPPWSGGGARVALPSEEFSACCNELVYGARVGFVCCGRRGWPHADAVVAACSWQLRWPRQRRRRRGRQCPRCCGRLRPFRGGVR
jgi:hypothetical protein